MIIEVKDLCFSYGKKSTLRNIDLSLRPGEIVGMVGPNGSGKSTLIKCLNGILRPTQGRVRLCGDDIGALEPREVARRVGYVPQGMSDMYSATVFDTVLMGRIPYLRWQPTEHDIRVASNVLRSLGLTDFSMHDVSRLSGGEKQKVMVARALAQEPKVLLLDEPTSNLDLKHQMEVMEIITRQAEEGISALVSVHDLNLALRYCDRFIMLKEGMVFAEGGKEMFTTGSIETVYGINVSVLDNNGRTLVVPEALV